MTNYREPVTVYKGTTAPATTWPVLWLDESVSPPVLKAYVSGAWTVSESSAAAAGLKKTYRYVYDFAVLGGTGAMTLTASNGALPTDFIVQNAFIDIISAVTAGAGGTGALSTGQGAGDLVTATLVAGAPWSSTGMKSTSTLLGSVATWIKTTASRSPTFTSAVSAVTAGKFNLIIEGFLSA